MYSDCSLKMSRILGQIERCTNRTQASFFRELWYKYRTEFES